MTTDALSILIPVTGFGRSGGFRVLSKLADEWAAVGYKVAFLAPCWSDSPYYPTRAEILWVNEWGRATGHQPNNKRSRRNALWRGLGVFRAMRALWLGIVRSSGSWSAILANHSLTAWPVALAPVRGAKIYYVQAYEPEYYAERRGPANRVLQFLSWASYFLPLRKIANAPLYLRYGPCHAKTWIPPGLDLEVYHPRQTSGAETCEPQCILTVGCIGRPESGKGTALAVEAFRLFAERAGSRARFRIADFGVPAEWLRDVPSVERIVPANDAELADYYRSVDVLLALGTVQHGAHHYPVMEAMACGAAVVTTGYMPATRSNAWIVNAAPGEAAAALQEIWARPDYASAKCKNARQAIERYAWSHIGRQFADELVKLLS